MSVESSLSAMRSVFIQPGLRFQLSCDYCGWVVEESRPYVEKRIRHHFAWDDAEPMEHVVIVCVDKALPIT